MIVLFGFQRLETLVPFRQNLDGLVLVGEHRSFEALLEGISDADPPGHPPKLLLDTQKGDLNAEQHLIAFADLAE